MPGSRRPCRSGHLPGSSCRARDQSPLCFRGRGLSSSVQPNTCVCRGVERDARPARPGGGRGAAWAAGTGQAGSRCTRPPPGADWLTSRPCGSCAGACEPPPAPLASRLAVPGSTRPRVCVRPAPLDSPLIADPCPRRTPSLPGRPFKVPRAICFLFIGGHGGGEKRPLQVLSSASIDPQAGLALSPR